MFLPNFRISSEKLKLNQFKFNRDKESLAYSGLIEIGEQDNYK